MAPRRIYAVTTCNRKKHCPTVDWSVPEMDLWDLVPEWLREHDVEYIHVLLSEDPKFQHWVRATCSRPWCAPCEEIRTWRFRKKVEDYIKFSMEERNIPHWWFLTRSIQNRHDPQSAFTMFLEAKRRFHKDTGRSWHPFTEIKAWIAAVECTYSAGAGYNVHQHMLVGSFTKPIRRFRIVEYWNKIGYDLTGASLSMTHVAPLRSRDHAVNYIAKYISKGTWGGLSRGRAFMIHSVLKGRNRFLTMPRTNPPKRVTEGIIYCCQARRGHCNRVNVSDPNIFPIKWDNLSKR